MPEGSCWRLPVAVLRAVGGNWCRSLDSLLNEDGYTPSFRGRHPLLTRDWDGHDSAVTSLQAFFCHAMALKEVIEKVKEVNLLGLYSLVFFVQQKSRKWWPVINLHLLNSCLAMALLVFTKSLQLLMILLRSIGIRLNRYLDNQLRSDQSCCRALQLTPFVMNLLMCLGWRVEDGNSNVLSSQDLCWCQIPDCSGSDDPTISHGSTDPGCSSIGGAVKCCCC